MEALLSLALLACPLGMGLMMWFMARGMRQDGPAEGGVGAATITAPSLEHVREEHRRLALELDRLEEERSSRSGR